MQKTVEDLIRLAYKEWKAEESKKSKKSHPDPEFLACFSEKPLSVKKNRGLRLHLIICENCSDSLAAQLAIEKDAEQEIPSNLRKWAKALPVYHSNTRTVVKILRLKKKIFLKLSSHKLIAAMLRHLQLRSLLIDYR